ncbi:heavy metal transport/detoxification superfamily protein [Striga asiatica]|uniref:Heavy metal transport/detoxification superfamily protein n=1 Tax=Striga asiatica TaxID=4170 RepID=A0A5A7P326_STRAF|nr:heavy metal transport/detoxification superfamily protein [Striga asiatica]
MTKKVVLNVQVRNEKERQKAIEAVSSLLGIESLVMDMEEKKLTVIGNVNPVDVMAKLKKFKNKELLSVGPAKEPKKKSVHEKKKHVNWPKEREPIAEPITLQKYYPCCTHHYYVHSFEENPNSCVIC